MGCEGSAGEDETQSAADCSTPTSLREATRTGRQDPMIPGITIGGAPRTVTGSDPASRLNLSETMRERPARRRLPPIACRAPPFGDPAASCSALLRVTGASKARYPPSPHFACQRPTRQRASRGKIGARRSRRFTAWHSTPPRLGADSHLGGGPTVKRAEARGPIGTAPGPVAVRNRQARSAIAACTRTFPMIAPGGARLPMPPHRVMSARGADRRKACLVLSRRRGSNENQSLTLPPTIAADPYDEAPEVSIDPQY